MEYTTLNTLCSLSDKETTASFLQYIDEYLIILSNIETKYLHKHLVDVIYIVSEFINRQSHFFIYSSMTEETVNKLQYVFDEYLNILINIVNNIQLTDHLSECLYQLIMNCRINLQYDNYKLNILVYKLMHYSKIYIQSFDINGYYLDLIDDIITIEKEEENLLHINSILNILYIANTNNETLIFRTCLSDIFECFKIKGCEEWSLFIIYFNFLKLKDIPNLYNDFHHLYFNELNTFQQYILSDNENLHILSLNLVWKLGVMYCYKHLLYYLVNNEDDTAISVIIENKLLNNERFMKLWKDYDMSYFIRQYPSIYERLLKQPQLNRTLQDKSFNYCVINNIEVPEFMKNKYLQKVEIKV